MKGHHIANPRSPARVAPPTPSHKNDFMKTLLIATTNPHKIEELSAILTPHAIEPISLDELAGDWPEPVEDGDSFEANAIIKARAYASATRRICLADDSGLEVDALDGAPGIHSARYAGTGAGRAQRDHDNNQRLLRELQGLPHEQRSARFVCVICVAAPDGRVLLTERGVLNGHIGLTPKGSHGFGYDPLFILPDGRTSAELPPEEKNRVSHRARAAAAAAPRLAALLD